MKQILKKFTIPFLSVLAVIGTVGGNVSTMSLLFFIGQPEMPRELLND